MTPIVVMLGCNCSSTVVHGMLGSVTSERTDSCIGIDLSCVGQRDKAKEVRKRCNH